MFPPIDDSILQENPQFAALRKSLVTNLLNTNGSSRNRAQQRERDATAQELREYQVRDARRHILQNALVSVPLVPRSSRDVPLSQELQELIVLLSQQLSTCTNQDASRKLLDTDPLYLLVPSYLGQIIPLLSAHIHAQAIPLAQLLSPTTNTSYIHRQIPKIRQHLGLLLGNIEETRANLREERQSIVPLTGKVLAECRVAVELTIRALEQTQHGVLARSSKSAAESLSLEAQTLQQESRILELSAAGALYSPEVRNALKIYGEHLRDGRARLRQREKEAQRKLARYGVGEEADGGRRERTLKEIGRVYGEMWDECDGIRREIEKLRVG